MILRLILMLLLISGCYNSTGFKSEPNAAGKKTNPKKIGLQQNGVTLKFYNLNKINPVSLPKFEYIKKRKIKN